MKRILLLFSALMISISALWAHDVEIDGIYYNIYEYNNTATVTYKGTFYHDYNEYSGSVTIPKTITYNSQTYSVSSIGYEAFRGCIGLTSVTIGNSVTSIGEEAFRGCSGLISVTIPNSVTSIGSSAFYATKLYDTESNWENGVLYIDNCIIKAKSDVVQGLYSIKEGTKLIASNAFNGCSGLTSVIIPNSVISIGYNAFSACSGLTSLEIPNSVTSIGGSAFSDCSSLTSVTIPSSVTSIGWGAFNACNGLTIVNYLGNIDNWIEIDFGSNNSNPTYYAKDLYIKGKLLTDVKISSADSIKSYSFNNCASIKSVEIGNNVTYIGFDVFDGTKLYNTESNWEKGFLYFDNCLIKAPSDIVKGSYSIKEGTRLIADGVFAGCNDLYSVVIPNSVTSLGNCAFKDCSGLSSVTIPNSVTSIGWSAFEGCSGLTSVTIPNSVTSIGSSAFYGCSGLTSVTIPNSVTSIGSSAFYGCSGLTSVTISNSVTSIGYSAFYGCSGLTLVTIPNNVISIEEGAFYGCSGLTLVTIPNNVISIGEGAFYGCSGLTSVTIPNSVTSIGSRAFYGCSGLTSVTIPNSVTSIDNSAFYGCSGLSSVTIPNSVTSISSCAFEGCSGLTSVTIPNSVTSIEGGAFYGCSGLSSVTIPNSVTSISSCAFEGCSGLTSVTIPNSVTSIGRSAFEGCSGLTSVEISNSVTSIDNSAFEGCSGLTSVTIPNSVTSIGRSAFEGCSGLTSVTIPNSVTYIGERVFEGTELYNTESNWENGVLYIGNFLIKAKSDVVQGLYSIKENTKLIVGSAFSYCSSLTSVTIPNSVTSIGSSAFSYCSGLTSVTIPNSVTSIEDATFYECWNLTSVEIPNSVTSIGSSAFSYCSGLTSVTIPNSVTSIEGGAFYRCSGLTSVTIPNSVISIEDATFYECWNLTSVEIPNSVTSIGFHAFYECRNLTSIEIPNSVTSIEDGAFYYCISLKEVTNISKLNIVKGEITHGYVAYYADIVYYVEGDFLYDDNNIIIKYVGDVDATYVEVPLKTKGIAENVFSECTKITSVVWNAKSCSDFLESTSAPFYNASSQITSFTFGDKVETIPSYLCYGMTGLKEINIPHSVTSIGENAFAGCKNLKKVTAYPMSVPEVENEDVFANYNAYLYVPCDVHEDYDLDDVFGNFKYVKCIESEEVDAPEKVEIEVDEDNNASVIWPSTYGANSYELVISKNGEVFCTLLFNENGQLTSIDFGNRSASVGFQFTVTGLDGASKYKYQMTAIDKKGNEITSYKGVFATNGYEGSLEDDEEDEPTDVVETLADANITISDGLITCQDTEFTIYNTLGQDVTAYNGSLQPGVYVVSVADDVVKVMMK